MALLISKVFSFFTFFSNTILQSIYFDNNLKVFCCNIYVKIVLIFYIKSFVMF